MNIYAVIDTNVLVSALLTDYADAATVQVMGHLFSGDFVPIFSKEIWDEYNEVLRRKKFHFSEDYVAVLLESIKELGEFVLPGYTGEILADPKDLPFYEAVLGRRETNTYLVTGNRKHFPEKPYIVTAREFIDILSATEKNNK